MKMKISIIAVFIATSCTIGPDYHRPSIKAPLSVNHEKIRDKWWESFGDATLNSLEEEAFAANHNLAIAAARVATFRASLNISESQLYPQIKESYVATRVAADGDTKPENSFSLGAIMSYEIDLWGKLRRAKESALAILTSSEAARASVKLALASDVAAGYFNLIALDQQIELSDKITEAYQKIVKHQELYYNNGMIDLVVLNKHKNAAASATSNGELLRIAMHRQATALLALLGRDPNSIVAGQIKRSTRLNDISLPTIRQDASSELLEKRPDIIAAEQRLISANADIGVAKADYFPTLSLSTLIGLTSDESSRLLQAKARYWRMTGSIALPSLNFIYSMNKVRIAKAIQDEARHNYQLTVQQAFKEVIDALDGNAHIKNINTSKFENHIRANQSLEIVIKKVAVGYSGELELLDAKITSYSAALAANSAKLSELVAAITLYKALGGGVI